MIKNVFCFISFFFMACGVAVSSPEIQRDETLHSQEGLSEEGDRVGEENEESEGEASNDHGSTENSTETISRLRPTLLMIHEFLYDLTGADGDGKLFVELFGTPNGDITDYQILFINGDGGAVTDQIKLPRDARLGENGLFLIADAKSGSDTQTFLSDEDYIDNFDPQNGPDCVQLLDDAGELLDAVGYGSPLPLTAANGKSCFEGTPADDVAANISLSRHDGIDTDDNAADFISLETPTPGSL